MADTNYSPGADEDLPRTLRREKEARQREANAHRGDSRIEAPNYRAPETSDYSYANDAARSGEGATVRYLDIPFLHLMLFFIKAVFAAIPAMFLLGVILWLAGDLLMAYFPQLVKMQIIFKIPN